MKHGHSFAAGALALFLVACGGSSNDSSGGSTVSGTPRVEAVVVGNAVDPIYRYQDPASIQLGDSVQFQLATIDADGNRSTIPGVSWRTNDAESTFGAISASSGLFTASTTRDSGTRVEPLTVTARYGDQDYSASYKVNPRQVRVLGRVLAQGSLTPLPNVIVDVYGPSNAGDPTSPISATPLATVVTAVNGSFRVSVRATNDTLAAGATASPLYFTVRTSSLPASGYYDSFVFRGQRFDAGNAACLAPLVNADGSPFTTGDRLLIDPTVTGSGNDPAEASNGTILVTPRSLFPTRPTSDGCGATSN